MIYITHYYSSAHDDYSINNVWEVKCEDAEQYYKNFMIMRADQMNFTINPHWLNGMSETVNDHLSESEYKKKLKEWDKFLKHMTFDRFIEEHLGGKKLEFKIIY